MQVPHRHGSSRAGFSLVDVCVAIAILAIALGTLVGTVFWAMRLEEANEEAAAASQSVRTMLEGMNAMPIEEVYAAYNADPADNPDAGRDYFADLQVDDPVLIVGKKSAPDLAVIFPDDVADRLAENSLPITLRLEWEGAAGQRSVVVSTVLRNP